MADPVTMIAVGGTLLSAYGGMQQANAAEAMGEAQQQQAEYKAKQMRVKAGQERASTQRRMIEEKRQLDIAQSNLTARAAASGGGTLDPSIVDIMGDLEAEGRYNIGSAYYEGEERALNYETGADIAEYEGRQAMSAGKAKKRAGMIKVAGGLLSDSTSLMDKYGSPFEEDMGGGTGYDPFETGVKQKPSMIQ